MSIKPINTLIGQAARGGKYFPRTNITDEIWRKLGDGSNLLFVAPRRVGKSSILFHLFDNPKGNLPVVYYISESVNNENEFYRKLFHHVLEKMGTLQKYQAVFKTWAKNLPSYVESIGPEGIRFRPGSPVSYYEELLTFVKEKMTHDHPMLVLIDEFASTVENIAQDEGDRAAIHFLETKRSLRQEPEVQDKLRFIYAGSIGLENIVSKMNCANLIMDLSPVVVPPLTRPEAERLTKSILSPSGIAFDKGAFDHLLAVIEWWIPYYFQIILDESYKLLVARDSTFITKEIVDAATRNALRQRLYFEHWFVRLRKAYKGIEFSFVKELLNVLSERKALPSVEVHDLSLKYGLDASYNDLVNALKHDGYINNSEDAKMYRFNSYLLREWWNANVAN